MFGSIKRLFQKKPPAATLEERRAAVERRFESLLVNLQEKLSRFLVTRNAPIGEMQKTADWKLSRTAAGLFRLESGRYSILINTEPFLIEKEGSVTGLLRISEASLCRVIADRGSVADFFRLAEPLKKRYSDLVPEYPADLENPGIDDLLRWDSFDIYQMVARNSPNTLAHVLIHADPQTALRLQEQLSIGKREQLIIEMETLLATGSSPSMNPHTLNRSLVEYEDALGEFRMKMKEYLLEKRLRTSKKLPPS